VHFLDLRMLSYVHLRLDCAGSILKLVLVVGVIDDEDTGIVVCLRKVDEIVEEAELC
jgi:hypothetical protein